MTIDEYLKTHLIKYKHLFPKNKELNDVVNLFKYGNKKAGWNAKTSNAFTNKFKQKKRRQPFHCWFLGADGVKWCKHCDNVYPFTAFNKNASKSDNLQAYCVDCTSVYMKKYKDRGAKSRNAVIRATPTWVDVTQIHQIYKNCPTGHHVDHIIPLNHANICGLHVPWNLQYLKAEDNIKKSNKFDGGWARWDGATFTP